MSAAEPQKVADHPAAGTVEPAPAPAPIEPVTLTQPVESATDAPKVDEPTTETSAPAATSTEADKTVPEKKAEPIYSGALGYKGPGLKNLLRFSKKYFWFGDEAVPASNLREYLRGEKPEVAHGVAAWSSQTGKGLLFFVKHADQKEHPAGALNLAYATDLVKDGTLGFNFKITGHKHAFEAQNAPERDGWFVAVERAITEAKASKDTIESSDGYKEQKEKIGKPTPLAAGAVSTPKKSSDAATKTAEAEAPVAAESSVAPAARAGSSSSSSSDEEKKAKKSKSRSVSRGKRASIFGGLLGKKDKTEDKAEAKKAEHKETEAATATDVNKDEPVVVAAPVTETSTAPVVTTDIPKVGEELKAETTPAPVDPIAPATTSTEPTAATEAKVEETPVGTTTKTTEDKPKPSKRGSIFGSFFEKVKSPTHEKKEADVVPPVPAAATTTTITTTKEAEPAAATETTAPLAESHVAPPTTETSVTAPKAEETKATDAKAPVSTPSKEKEHFSFGKFFGSKDRTKSPAPAEKTTEATKTSDAAPKIDDAVAPTTTAAEPATTTAAPATETVEPAAAPATETKAAVPEEKTDEATPKKEKRGLLSTIQRSLSRSGKKETPTKEKKENVAPVPEATETSEAAPLADKTETPASSAPAEKTIGDVVPEAVTIGEAPKSNPAVSTTA